MKCRVCNHIIKPFISFGKMPIANGFLKKEQFKSEYFFELAPAFCEKCFTVQLETQPDPKMMFHENYAFFLKHQNQCRSILINMQTGLLKIT